MVSSCHFDFISYYWLAHFLVYHQNIPANILHGIAGTVYLSPIIQMHGLWLLFIKAFINKGADFWPNVWFFNNNYFTVNIDTWVQFVRQPGIGWILFLLKIPYLIGEAILIFLIIKMVEGVELKRKVLNFLVFNPVSIFIIYIFGAGDIFFALFLVLSLYLIKKQRIYLGMFFLGLAMMKFYILILLPFFVIILSDNVLERIKLVFLGLSPLIVAIISSFIIGIPLAPLATAPHSGYIFSLALLFNHVQDKIFPFVVLYFLLFLYMFYSNKRKQVMEELYRYSLIAFMIFYALSFFHPQYFFLVVPLIALQFNKIRHIGGMFILLTVCYIVYTFHWLSDLSCRLFLPLGPDLFVSLKSPHDLIDRFMPADNFIGIFRSIFLSVSLILIYFLVKDKSCHDPN